MTAIEVETPGMVEEIVSIMEEPVPVERHRMHLTSAVTEYLTAEGMQRVPSITATCSCGVTMTGLQDATQVFAVLTDHCTPL